MKTSSLETLLCWLLTVAILCTGNAAAAAEEAAGQRRVAFLALTGDNRASQAVALLESLVLSKGGVQLVDRDQLDATLAERRLGLSLAAEADAWRDLAAVVPADVFVLVATEGQGDQAVLELRFVESRTGIELGRAAARVDELARDLAELADHVQRAVAKTGIAPEERIYLAFLGVRGDVGTPYLDEQSRAFSAVLERRLAEEPTVTLLERNNIKLLAREKIFADLPLDLQPAGVILHGGLRHANDSDGMLLTLSVARRGRQPATGQVQIDLAQPEAAAAAAVELAAKLARADTTRTALIGDQEGEAVRLAKQAHDLLQRDLNNKPQLLNDAVDLAEAALALDGRPAHVDVAIHANGLRSDGKREILLGVRRVTELRIQRLRELARTGAYGKPMHRYTDVPEFPVPGPDEPELVPLYESVRQLWLEHVELATRLVAKDEPLQRERFHANMLVRKWSPHTKTPAEHCQRLLYHLKLAVEAHREDVEASKAEGGWYPLVTEAAGYLSYAKFRGGAEHYQPLLDYLGQSENPLLQLHGLGLRMRLDEPNAVEYATNILDALTDPDSALNRFLDNEEPLPQHGYRIGQARGYFGVLKDGLGAERVLSLFEQRVQRMEERGAAPLLDRWYEAFTDEIATNLAVVVKGEQAERLLRRMERLATPEQGQAPRAWQSRVLAGVQQALSRYEPRPPSPWEAYDLQTCNLEPAEAEKAVNAVIALQRNRPGDEEETCFLVLLRSLHPVVVDGQPMAQMDLYRVSRDAEHAQRLRRHVVPFDEAEQYDGIHTHAGTHHNPAHGIDGTLIYGTKERGLIVVDDEINAYGTRSGAPADFIDFVERVGDRVFVGARSGIAEFDLGSRRFRIIAAAGSVKQTSLLDAMGAFNVEDLEADPSGNALWISVSCVGKAAGVWRYDLAADRLDHVINTGRGPVTGEWLAWFEGRLLMQDRDGVFAYEIDPNTLLMRPTVYKNDLERALCTLPDPADILRIGDHYFGGKYVITPDGERHSWKWNGEDAQCLHPIERGYVAISRHYWRGQYHLVRITLKQKDHAAAP